MARAFPGMDPWLERPALWPDVHLELIAQIRRQLQGLVGPRYYVAAEERVYLEAPIDRQFTPDSVVIVSPSAVSTATAPPGGQVADQPTVLLVEEIEQKEHFLEIREVDGGHRVVTVIEVLSPANKRPGAGREEYLRKQADVLASQANLVEVDLLRGGEPTVALPEGWASRSHYRVAVSRASDRRRREVYLLDLRARLPRVRVPLEQIAPDVVLDLPLVLDSAFEAGAYDRRTDYATDPSPSMSPGDLAWAREQVERWRRSG
jgi:hypothetical protein